MERVVPCPRCARGVRLGATELSMKSAQCNACAASFELVPEMFVGDELMRRLGNTLGAADQPPPSPLVRARESDQGLEIQLRAHSPRTDADKLAILWLILGLFGVAGLFAGIAIGMSWLVTLLVAAAAAIPFIAGLKCLSFFQRDVVRLSGEGITVERRPGLGRAERIPLDGIDAVRMVVGGPIKPSGHVFGRVRIIRRGHEPLLIGDGMAHDDETLAWVASTLERKLRRLRVAALDGARPRGALAAPAGDQGTT